MVEVIVGLLAFSVLTAFLVAVVDPERFGRWIGRVSRGWREDVGYGWRP